MKKIIREVLFYNVTLVTAADNEIIHSVSRINFHDVPKDRFTGDLDHRLGF
jgi:hypothetical protein